MPFPRPARTVVAAAVTALALLTVSCSPAEAPAAQDPTPQAPVETPAGEAPASTPEPTETAVPAEDVTCETLVLPETVATFTEAGWTPKEEPFLIGEREMPGGIRCMWADFSVESNDMMVLAWAPVAADDAAAIEAELVAEGWKREEDADGVLVTEPNPLTVDDDGYGFTYRFGDGWVTLADWKANLVLIEQPAL